MIGQDVWVLTATLVVLAVLLLAAAVLLVVAVLQGRARRRSQVAAPAVGAAALEGPASGSAAGAAPAGAAPGMPAPGMPALGMPARVWLERGERVTQRLRRLGAEHPTLAGAADDAAAVLMELRAAAGEVAGLDAARARLPIGSLRAEQRLLDDAITAAAGGPSVADLQAAREAVAARLALAERHRAATGALLARMRAAVAGLEQAEDELTGLLAELGRTAPVPGAAGTIPSATVSATTESATTDLADRLAGLRAGLAEVRVITARITAPASGPGQGQPGDLPGSVEPPAST